MLKALRRHTTTMLIAMVTAAVTAGGPALAAAVAQAVNADKVDGKHAVAAGASVANRKGKLVATSGKTGRLPNNIIAKAPNADKLDGVNSTGFLRAAAKAADADKLDGLDSANFLRANGKAVDADQLDGQNSSAFALNSQLASGSVRLTGATVSTAVGTLDEFTVNVPAAGVLLLTVSGHYWFDADSTSTSARMASGSIALCDSAANFGACDGTYRDIWYEDPDNTTDFNAPGAFTLARTLAVEPGPRTFHVNGATDEATEQLSLYGQTRVTAVWMPSNLGVTSD